MLLFLVLIATAVHKLLTLTAALHGLPAGPLREWPRAIRAAGIRLQCCKINRRKLVRIGHSTMTSANDACTLSAENEGRRGQDARRWLKAGLVLQR